MSNWQKVKIGDFLIQYRNEHIVKNENNYGQVTISKNGYVKFRGILDGKSIGRKRQFVIDLEKYPNTVIFTRQGISDGAIGFAPAEVHNCIVTENMPMFSLSDEYDKNFIELILQSDIFKDEISKLIPTGSAQKSIHERELLQIEFILPIDKKEQVQIATNAKNKLIDIKLIQTEITTQQSLLKQLKQTILQEAMEGKLTAKWRAENPDIGTAKELLNHIKNEREKLVKEKKIKAKKPLSPINEDEIPFDIPQSWEWCKIGDIVRVKIGSTPDRQNLQHWNGNINWVASGEVANNYIYETKEKITELGFNNTSLVVCPSGTVLVAMIGQGKTRGQTSILKISAATNQNVAALIISHNFLISEYLWFYFLSMYDKTRSNATGGNQPALNSIKINNMTIPLPPLEEQKEIVATIEKLFAITDELTSEINQNKTTVDNLMATVLKEAFEK